MKGNPSVASICRVRKFSSVSQQRFADQQKKFQLLEQRDKILRKYNRVNAKQAAGVRGSFGDSGSAAKERFQKETRDDVDLKELKSLIGQQAVSTMDKYQLLNQRDKLLRKYNVKTSDVNQASVFRGTCPDMCPEKERYRREVQNLLHKYEIVAGQHYSVDHNRAVKDYSRSSADQEEPLPHELRPVEVLERTMNYLVGCIAFDEPSDESQLQIWYDFLWNRTRAIRKDITQQMLTDRSAVCLIEKCVRFHIYAGYRLCELDMSDFDQKFNTEHLTKCLLSLRHMYDDLNKAGVECENEAEFRSYYVLLNLNDSNILRQVLTYKQNVRESNEIRFALKLFSTLQNNNYVKFFRLIRENASFLHASLVHRYFNQVRVEAIKILVKSYGDRTQFPVNELAKLLCFENVEEAVNFCSLYGLTSIDGNVVLLNRSHFTEPESEASMKRSKTLIETKRCSPIGEVLNGGMIASVVFPQAVISFDADHRYVNDPVLNSFLEAFDDVFEHQDVPPTVDKQVVKTVDVPNDNLLFPILNNLLVSVVHQTIKKPVSDVLSVKFVDYFLTKSLGEFSKNIAQNVFAEQKYLADQKSKRRKEAVLLFNGSTSEIFEDLLDEICEEEVSNISKHEFNIARCKHEDKIRKEIYSISTVLRTEILNEFLDAEVPSIIRQCYECEVSLKLTALDRIRNNLISINVRKCFDHWLRKMRRKKHHRKLLDDFPLYPGRKYNSYVNVVGSTPPKKIRLTAYHDCPTSDCCKLASNKGETEGSSASTNGVLKEKDDSNSNEQLVSATRELREMLETLKRGIKLEQEKLPTYLSNSPIKS